MSISNEAVVELIQTTFPDAQIEVSGDGYKYQATVISSNFEGMSKVKRHQLIYKALSSAIESGELHALTIIASTPTEAATPN